MMRRGAFSSEDLVHRMLPDIDAPLYAAPRLTESLPPVPKAL